MNAVDRKGLGVSAVGRTSTNEFKPLEEPIASGVPAAGCPVSAEG
jgi:hypothetical protein